ncbi:tubulin binding cofactor A [Macrolepiota fuliginosa MF-IS2]|uniref:Tubulin-specific chaperone A n=1 Tax=Macrolepiota fuliginosa MF-IS2 TaxID=1400762 RepID=A0A9P5XH89_9AGAR|nr:tubulin binding cofactor A [Macrolepiota fuliginosa MF-IS2]
MSEIAAIQKQLRIKSGVVRRYEKETLLYRNEVEALGKKLDKFIAEKAEDWDIKNTKRMIEESEKMIIDTKNRMDKATGELKDLVEQVKDRSELAGSEELGNAQQLIEGTA